METPITSFNFRIRHILPGWIGILILLLLACPAKTGESAYMNDHNNPTEFELKATYLYNFLKFIKWPENQCNLHQGRSTMISVLGESPFNQVLKNMQEKLRQIDSDLELTFYGPYREDMEFTCCCLMFIAASEHHNMPLIMEKLTGKPILTVSEENGSVNQGVMITLVEKNKKIRWVINRGPVSRSGLHLSAKLFDIAAKVIDE